MPTFSSAQVTDPFPNILYNPAAVDAAIAKTQSELGNLDINRQELQLRQDAASRDVAFGDYLKQSLPTDGTTGAAGAVPGGGGSFLGALAQIESGDKNIVSGTDKDNQGLTLAQGGNPAEISQGHFQIHTGTWKDFAPQAGVDVSKYPNAMSAPREIQAQVASVIPFKRFGPRTQTMMRQQFGDIDSNRTVGELAGLGPRVGSAAVAGPVAVAPPPATQQAGPLPVPPIPPGNPNAGPRVGAAPTVPAVDPNARVEADDPNTAAVKQASAALLQMPEPDAAAAYPGVVRELQARGFAMNAPPTYPGHAALQALVGGGDAAAPAVEPSRQAMRLGGVAAAGDAAGPGLASPDVQPNRMAYGTTLPGVTIGLPTNGLAPPPTAAAPVVTAAAPAQAQPQAARPPLEAPPAAPSRVIQREPLIQSGIFAGLTRTQASTIANTPGVKPATIMEQIATARHQNDVIRQGDATQAAIDEKENYARRHTAEQEAQAAADKKEAQRVTQENLRLSQETGAREAAKAHELTLDEIAPKMDDGTATPAEKRRYARSYYALQQAGGQPVEMTDPDDPSRKIPAMLTRRLPASYPEPEGGALPLVMSSPGAGKKAELKPLPDKERDQLLDGGSKLDQVITQRNSFRPDYAGYGSGWVGDLANMMKSAAGESPQADWWKSYQRYRLAIRQGISGQSLTKSEEAAFDRADINPGMAPSTIEHNLQLQQELTERIHNRRVKSLEADGYNARAIQAASGDRPDSAPSSSTMKPPPKGSKVIIP